MDFDFPWAELIHRFKFRAEPAMARTLADLMADDPVALATAGACDVVAPIPSALPRLVERGYNQSWELVRQLRRTRRLPKAWPDLLERAPGAAALHTLPKAERLTAAQHLFTAARRHAPRLQGANVLLVDDVMTTGATVQAATLALRQAGARTVHAWVFARTPRPTEAVDRVE